MPRQQHACRHVHASPRQASPGPAPTLQLLTEVYLPLLSQHLGASAPREPPAADAQAHSAGDRELLGSMQKFVAQVTQSLQQLNGEICLSVSQPRRLLVLWGAAEALQAPHTPAPQPASCS